jgi:hypothetical protein
MKQVTNVLIHVVLLGAWVAFCLGAISLTMWLLS